MSLLILRGAAVYRRDMTSIMSWASAPEVRAAYFFRSLLDFPERRLVESHATVIVPFHDRVFFIRAFHGAEFSRRLSKISQTLDAISRSHLRAGVGGLGEWGPSGPV